MARHIIFSVRSLWCGGDDGHSATRPMRGTEQTSTSIREDVPESVEEFDPHLAVVERETHVVGAVEDHVDQIDDEDRRR